MSLLNRLFSKAVTDARKWMSSSTRVISGDSHRPSFSNGEAIKHYSSWIYAAANLNAYAVASQPLRLYVRNRSAGTKLWNTRRTDRRAKSYLSGSLEQLPSRYAMTKAAEYGDEYEVVTDNHPVLDLLSKANPWQNGFEQTVLRVLYLELTGNAYLHPVLDRRLGIPVELWTMPSQWVEIVPGKEEFVDGYLYGVSYEKRAFFERDEVIHFKRPNPKDIYYGMGKVEAAWMAATNNQSLHDMDYHWFANKARPDWLLTVKGDASQEEIDRLEAQIDSKLRGTRRTGRFLTATADIDIKPLSFSPKDMMGREQIVEEIAAVFGVPVSMLKANDPNLASATVGFTSWKATSVLPLMRMDEEVLNQTLLPLFGIEDDAFLAYDNPVAADEKFETEKRRAYAAGGILTVNEVREMEGLEAVSDPAASRLLINGQPLGGQPPQPAASPFAGLFGASAQPRQDAALTFGTATDTKTEPLAPKVVEATETKAAGRKDALGDCVSDKIPKLLDEGYEQDQAVAIAYSMCQGKGLEEAIGKAEVGSIDTKPPQSVADNARRALDVRETKPESQRGMTEVGIARARDLANRANLSEDTIRRMVAYFERHQSDKDGSTWGDQGKGWQAWNGWGGDEGFAWAKGKVEEFDRARAKKSCGCGCAKTKTVRQSDFVGKHATDFGSWLKVKSAEKEAEKIGKSESEAASKVSRVFDDQVKALLAKLAAAEKPTQQLIAEAERIIRARPYQRAIVEALSPYIREAIQTGVNIGLDTVSKVATEVDFDLERQDLSAYADSESIRLSRQTAAGVVETQSVRVREILGTGLENGESSDQLASRVQEWAEGQKDEDGSWSRARTIARTEAMRAARSAEVEAWDATGMVKGKTWLLAPDPCEFCDAAAKAFGANPIGLGETFYKKGDTLAGADGGTMILDFEDVAGPPLHPNCRCSMQPQLEDDLEAIYRENRGQQAGDEERRRINLEAGIINP
jgi:HK97 family phage portal protein